MSDAVAQSPGPAGPPWLSVIRRSWDLIPCKYFIVLMALLMYFGDRAFPFSNFPMYSGLAKKALYVYVTDGEDKPIGFNTQFAIRAANVSKTFRTNLKKICRREGIDEKQAQDPHYLEAGHATLAALILEGRQRRPEIPLPAELKIYHVTISRKGDRIEEKKRFAGSVQTAELPTEDSTPAEINDAAEEGE